MLLDAGQCLRVADGLNRAFEGILDRGFQERGVPAAPHAAHRLGHLFHARLVRAREQVGQMNED